MYVHTCTHDICTHVVCCVGDFKEKTVHTFIMCAHFPDVYTHTSFDVILWIIGYFLFTHLRTTVESLSKGRLGTKAFVLWIEMSLTRRVVHELLCASNTVHGIIYFK